MTGVIRSHTDSEFKIEYASMVEAMKVAKAPAYQGIVSHVNSAGKIDDPSFVGVKHWSEVENLAVDGWETEADSALEAAGHAIETVEKTIDMPAFTPILGVAGCEVDIDRYLRGEPENMVDYELVKAPRNGRVITLCSSASASWAVSTETIMRRGHIVTALALALTRIGYAVELWVDIGVSGRSGVKASMRVLVKSPNDELDPAKIMHAYAHPSVLRGIGFGLMHTLPGDWPSKIGAGFYYGTPIDPIQDLPEGTIYLPCLFSDGDVPDADKALLGHLKDLGVID